MRIILKTEGGFAHFPGLQQPLAVSVQDLPQELQTQLRNCITGADFFNLPSQPDPALPGAADYRTYIITVQIPQRTHTVTIHEPIKDEPLRQLIQLLRGIRREQ